MANSSCSNDRPKFYVGDSRSFTRAPCIKKSSQSFCSVMMDSDTSSKDSTTSLIHHCPKHQDRKGSLAAVSACSGSQREIYDKYQKLKTFFWLLCVMNVIVILVASGTVAFLLVKISTNEQKMSNILSTKSSELTGRTEVDGTNHQKPTGSSGKLSNMDCTILRKNSSVQIKGNCSLEDLANNAVKIFRKEEYVIHLVNGVPERESSSGNGDHRIINWRQDSETRQSIQYSTRTHSIVVPTSGYYFIYNRMVFSLKNKAGTRQNNRHISDIEIKHSFHRARLGYSTSSVIHSSSLNCSNDAFVHSSYLQRVIYLEAADEIRVVVSFSGRVQVDEKGKYAKENSFGMFKV